MSEIPNNYILLVEDNPRDAALTRRAFRKQKIQNEILLAKDGVEALEMLLGKEGEEPPPLPMLVLLDLKMPRLNGLDVLKEMRAHERTRLVPVVVMTTSREQRDVIESYDLGANSYVRKPVNHRDFDDAVKQLGFYWLLLNEAPQLS